MLKRRLILACSLVAASGVSMAQTYPNKLIKLQVPFAPGGTTDIIARIIADPLGKVLALTKTCLLPALIVGLLMVNVSPARKPFWSTKLLFANSAPMTSILLAAMN